MINADSQAMYLTIIFAFCLSCMFIWFNPFVLGHAACLGHPEGDELTPANSLSYSLLKPRIALIIVNAEIDEDKLWKTFFGFCQILSIE